ncbi:MAG: DUF2878 domain-containing protein [Halioglobus sp.]|nr:DUF2878 domain-containing protein [Halioglobus sp.]
MIQRWVNNLKSSRWLNSASSKVVNVLMFNAAWFAILLTQSSVIAPMIVALSLFAHFQVMGKGKPELLLIAGVTCLGFVIDQILFGMDVFNLSGKAAPAPLWLTCLWPVFATTLMHAFDWLQGRIIVSSVVGAVGGCLSYIAGVRLTQIEFGSAMWGPLIIATLWAIIFPLFLKISEKITEANSSIVNEKSPAAQRLQQ